MRDKPAKKLLVVPPIPVYDRVGGSLSDFPAPVIRERLRVLKPYFRDIHVVAGSKTEESGRIIDENIHIHRIQERGRLGFIKQYVSRIHGLLDGDTSMLNMNPLYLGVLANIVGKTKKTPSTTLFISFPRQWSVKTVLSENLYRMNLKLSTINACVTPNLRQELERLGGEDIKLAPNHVRGDLHVDVKPKPDTILYAARLSPEKRPGFMLEAFKKIREKKI